MSNPADATPVRACQCSFCRRHGSVAVADPMGEAVFSADSPDDVIRYSFEARTADFLLCAHCGVYVGAIMEAGQDCWSVVNVAGTGISAFAGRQPEAADFEDETAQARVARRKFKWTPTRVEFAAALQGCHNEAR